MRVIGFCGKAGSGKTTAARMTAVTVRSFATPLKKCVGDLFKFSYDQLYGSLYHKEMVDERYGVSPRYVMQRFGTEFVRTTVPHLWDMLMKQELLEAEQRGYDVVAIDDVRFKSELDLIEEFGGNVVEIIRGDIKDDTHASEIGLCDYTKIKIYNDGTIEDLKSKLLSLSLFD